MVIIVLGGAVVMADTAQQPSRTVTRRTTIEQEVPRDDRRRWLEPRGWPCCAKVRYKWSSIPAINGSMVIRLSARVCIRVRSDITRNARIQIVCK